VAQTPEGKVKDKARALYKQHGAKYDRAAMTGMGQNGRADDLVCRSPDGHFGGVEFKRDNVFKVSALQRVWLQETERCGGSSMVVNLTNLTMLEQWLKAPGWRVNAVFEKDTCVGHVARATGHEDVFIKNPDAKSGKDRASRA
jgi:hypothetical protein